MNRTSNIKNLKKRILTKEKILYHTLTKRDFWINAVILFMFMVLFAVYFFSETVKAVQETNREKIITSIEIQHGDTLWGIAKRFISDEYSSLNEYIDEIKKSNHLKSDTIHEGNYIVVPYYVDKYR